MRRRTVGVLFNWVCTAGVLFGELVRVAAGRRCEGGMASSVW
ncbi:hypothetical protein ACIBQ6_33730 [Nonomuraea sp. NPDC049655]